MSELLCQKKLGKKLSEKNRDYLQYLLINNGYVIIKRFDAKEEAIRQVGGKEAKSPLS